jgi:hypothetical protein
MMPVDTLWPVALFEQCHIFGKVANILDKLKGKKQPKEKESVHLSVACSHVSNH